MSRAWLKHTERGALLAVLRQMWLFHLARKGLTKDSCPIRDMFEGADDET